MPIRTACIISSGICLRTYDRTPAPITRIPGIKNIAAPSTPQPTQSKASGGHFRLSSNENEPIPTEISPITISATEKTDLSVIFCIEGRGSSRIDDWPRDRQRWFYSSRLLAILSRSRKIWHGRWPRNCRVVAFATPTLSSLTLGLVNFLRAGKFSQCLEHLRVIGHRFA